MNDDNTILNLKDIHGKQIKSGDLLKIIGPNCKYIQFGRIEFGYFEEWDTELEMYGMHIVQLDKYARCHKLEQCDTYQIIDKVDPSYKLYKI